MKKLWSALLMGVWTLGFAETYKVVIEPNYPPMEFYDENGQLVGFDIDLINMIAKNQKFDIKIFIETWERVLPSVKDGTHDIAISAISIAPEHVQNYDFSEPYLKEYHVIAYKDEQLSNVHSLQDIGEHSVGVLKDSYTEDVLKEHNINNIVGKKTLFLAMAALARGDVDMVVANETVASYIINHHDELDFKVTRMTDEVLIEESAIAVQKGNRALLEKINNGLRELRSNGELEKLAEKWVRIRQ